MPGARNETGHNSLRRAASSSREDGQPNFSLYEEEHGDLASTPLRDAHNHGSLNQNLDTSLKSRSTPSGRNSPSRADVSRTPATAGFGEETEKFETVDWHVESQGRRVGYEDLTAIDWIFEYTKERQRLRQLLASSAGLTGHAKQLIDASNVWIVLVLTGLSVGFVAAFISIVSDWLADIKTGYCKTGQDGGRFYLSKQFCCWGHDDLSQCQDWTPWRTALKIGNIGGAYIVEYIFFVLYAMLFAVSAAFLVKSYSVYARQSGIPEIKTLLGGFVMKRFLGPWTLVTKSLGLCLAVASGLWLGKEGPLVHVACCCANIIMKPFDSLSRNEARKREVLSAAAASGISVAFGAPIGGVLFSLEQLSYYFPDKTMWQSFVCAMIAAVTLQALNPFHTGKIVLYQVTYTTGWHGFEVVPFVLLGVTGGIFGGLFIKINVFIAKLRRSEQYPFRNRPILEVFVVASLAAMINFPNLFMRAQLSELVYYLFAECATIGDNDIFGLCKVTTAGSLSMVTLLITASILGTLFAAMTFGLQLPAGIILPSLAIGALYGRALGVIVELIHKHNSTSFVFAACEPDVPCITPGTYAIVGAASALAGATRMTASIVVIMFELTGALTYVLPIMVAVMLAKWIGDAFSLRGIYESWIQLNEYPFVDNKDDMFIPHPVVNIMTRMEEMTCLDAARRYSVEDLRNLLKSTSFRGFPVIQSSITALPGTPSGSGINTTKNTLLGYISRNELSYALDRANQTLGRVNRSLTATTLCYFTYSQDLDSGNSVDLRPWIDQTPITLHANSSLQQAVSMFQKLGLRYLLFVDRGAFRGLLTKKDVWWILNAGENQRSSDFVAGAGIFRENDTNDEAEGAPEEQTLLRQSESEDPR